VAHLSRNAQLYLRVLLMRRQVMLRVTATKVVLGVVAALFLLAALALGDIALFYWLAPRLGDAGAAGLLAALQLAIGAVLLIAALRTQATAELDALRETEQAALAMLTDEADTIMGLFSPAARTGRNLGLALDLATVVMGLLKKKQG
jgi:hypothetical protein